jgi:hypothetical protein
MKNLVLSCLAVLVLSSVVGCSDSCDRTSSTTTQSASMQTDSKDMHPSH